MNERQHAEDRITDVQTEVIITATHVTPHDCITTLLTRFPKCFLHFEQTVYTVMKKICQNYSGGFWECYVLSNGGFYMAPMITEPCSILIPFGNGYEGEMSADAAGITACMYAYSFLAETEPIMVDHYWQLRDFAENHVAAGEIRQAIDAGAQ